MRERIGRLKSVMAMLVATCAGGASAGNYVLRAPAGSFKNPGGGTLSYTNVSSPYTGGNANYGGSRTGDTAFVYCDGKITTVWDWVPDKIPGTSTDDPLDVHPEHVILHEQSNASYSGWFFNEGYAVATCDNGLGFTPTYTSGYIYLEGEEPVVIGQTFSGTASGTRYKRIAGAATLTIECDPEAKVIVDSGMCSASLSYKIEIIHPRVSLAGVTDFTSPRAIKFITGQNIGATVTLVRSGNQLSEQTPLAIASTGYQWSFENDDWQRFKDYTFGSIGKKYILETVDLQQSQLSFYTNENGAAKVLCNFKVTQPSGARLEGGLPDVSAKSKTVGSVRPDYDDWDVINGAITPNVTGGVFGYAGTTNANQGQEWSGAEISVPAPFGQVGQGCFCQLITSDRTLTRSLTQQGINAGAATFFYNTLRNQQAVDTGLPYLNVTWSLPNAGSSGDSPFQPVTLSRQYTDLWLTSTAADAFNTWMMYRPPSKDGRATIWRPVAKYAWRWGATATYSNGQWSVAPDASGKDGDPLAEYSEYPEWTLTSPSVPPGITFLPN